MEYETAEESDAATYAWHVHHDILVEPLTEPIETRIAYIKASKPRSERATRLRLLKPVQGTLPPRLVTARAVLDRANAVLDRANAEWDRAWAVWYRAKAECLPEIETLHRQECPDCPWDGKTIFPERR